MKIIETFIKFLFWIRIVAAPTFFAAILGALLYVYNPNKTNYVIAIGIIILGLIVGIIWATRIWKKTGTVEFMSKVTSTPELDKV